MAEGISEGIPEGINAENLANKDIAPKKSFENGKSGLIILWK